MNRTPVSSNCIASVGYENGALEIAFVDGGVYQYFNVPKHIYPDLISAASKGQYFHDHIKDKFQTIEVEW